jgi:hypothetical protein
MNIYDDVQGWPLPESFRLRQLYWTIAIDFELVAEAADALIRLVPHRHSLGPAVQVAECKTSAMRLFLVSHDPHWKEGSPNIIHDRYQTHCHRSFTSKRRPCEEQHCIASFSFFSSLPFLPENPSFSSARTTTETPYPAPTRTTQRDGPPAVVRRPAGRTPTHTSGDRDAFFSSCF